ncbi:hypothetical protein U5640_40715 [Streptomyces sp. SS7]|uniref:hypothetical protein n=1 Tax=Streptomyces sp. SS7 TaxID=3108485 RepID=UPI0030EC4AC7
MTHPLTTGEVMSAEFLSGTEAALLSASLAGRGDAAFAVLTGRGGEPAGLVGADGHWPAVVVAKSLPLKDLLADKTVLRALTSGIPAVVVAEGGRVAGVVGAQALDDLLAADVIESGPGTKLGLEAQPMGLPDPHPALLIQCVAPVPGGGQCGATNAFPRWPPEQGNGECVEGGHAFRPFWEA